MSDPRLDIKYDWRLRLERGRTAWSCHVIADGRTYAARYWFDGDFVQNAMEDAAEVALKDLDPVACQPPSRGPPLGTVKFE
ncbi:uncharacterized protein BDV14DRAFT_200047 [Aspergillus stella-maris]|uniref:uncharacterized protein n=1 Tax=Aspergillus stella-maris TaxID=1810926 RepID=UPI003CCDC5ED